MADAGWEFAVGEAGARVLGEIEFGEDGAAPVADDALPDWKAAALVHRVHFGLEEIEADLAFVCWRWGRAFVEFGLCHEGVSEHEPCAVHSCLHRFGLDVEGLPHFFDGEFEHFFEDEWDAEVLGELEDGVLDGAGGLTLDDGGKRAKGS